MDTYSIEQYRIVFKEDFSEMKVQLKSNPSQQTTYTLSSNSYKLNRDSINYYVDKTTCSSCYPVFFDSSQGDTFQVLEDGGTLGTADIRIEAPYHREYVFSLEETCWIILNNPEPNVLRVNCPCLGGCTEPDSTCVTITDTPL